MSDHVFETPKPVWDFNDYARYMPPCGYIRDYTHYALQCTDAPPLYHILSSVGVVSGAVSPHVDLVFQNELHPLHLFLLLIGNSSESRKTSAIKRAIRVAEPVFAPLSHSGERLWWPVVSSPEGITEELAKEANRILILSEWTEMHRLAGKAGYWQHAAEFWNLIYDALNAQRSKAKSKTVIIRPRVTILGASTPSLLQEAVSRGDWLAGKMARYVIGCMTRPTDREMESSIDLPWVVDDLRARLGELVQPSPFMQGTLSQDAWGLMREWQKSQWWRELRGRAPEHLVPSFSRAQEHIFRLAAIYEASMSYPSHLNVSPEAMLAAIALVEWCYESMCKTLPNVSDYTQPLQRVTNILASAGAKGMSRSTLLRTSKLTTRQMNEVLATLSDCRDILVHTGSNGQQHYVYVAPCDE